jgi:hypothetical protein
MTAADAAGTQLPQAIHLCVFASSREIYLLFTQPPDGRGTIAGHACFPAHDPVDTPFQDRTIIWYIAGRPGCNGIVQAFSIVLADPERIFHIMGRNLPR